MQANLNSTDWVLAILYANNQKPIFGKLMFVKEVFLVAKEIDQSLDQDLQFFPYDLGPYSKKLAELIDQLVQDSLVNVEGSGGDFVFELTNEGKRKAQIAFERLAPHIQQLLDRKRRAWDQLGYRGIVRLVYTRYPEYATKSKIAGMLE